MLDLNLQRCMGLVASEDRQTKNQSVTNLQSLGRIGKYSTLIQIRAMHGLIIANINPLVVEC